ncbi:MAG: hypothetical protein ACFB6R_02425 [Alphaproteobacteria bacterium]
MSRPKQSETGPGGTLSAVFGLLLCLGGCGLFGGDRDATSPGNAPFPDLADLPQIAPDPDQPMAPPDVEAKAATPSDIAPAGGGLGEAAQRDGQEVGPDAETRSAVLRGLQARRLRAELERDVLPTDLIARLPAPPAAQRSALIPARLLGARRSEPGDATLAPPPSAMPPVLPAGGASAPRPGETSKTP